MQGVKLSLGLTVNENKAITEFKESILKLPEGNIRSVVLFGSKATGQATTYSDIDLLVVVGSESLELWDAIQAVSSKVSLKYDLLLSVKIMSVEHYEYLRKVESLLIKNIESHGANIWKAA